MQSIGDNSLKNRQRIVKHYKAYHQAEQSHLVL